METQATQTVCLGRKKVGGVVVAPHQKARLILPQCLRDNWSCKEEILLNVNVVLSDYTGDLKSGSSLALPKSTTLPSRRPAARLRFYTGEAEDTANCDYFDRQRSRCIGVRRKESQIGFGAVTYRTETIWIPLKGRCLFVENLSARDEARVTIAALAFKQIPEIEIESDDESPYAEITINPTPDRPLSWHGKPTQTASLPRDLPIPPFADYGGSSSSLYATLDTPSSVDSGLYETIV